MKEPYSKTTSGGGTSIRFGHLRHTLVDGEDKRIPEKWRPTIGLSGRRSLEKKDDRNRFYKWKQYSEAARW